MFKFPDKDTYVCDIQVSGEGDDKALKGKTTPCIFTFKKDVYTSKEKKASSEKRKPFQGLAESKHQTSSDENDSIYILPIANDQSSTCENCTARRKIIAREDHQLEADFSSEDLFINRLKEILLSYDNFVINGKLDQQPGLEVEKFNILYE